MTKISVFIVIVFPSPKNLQGILILVSYGKAWIIVAMSGSQKKIGVAKIPWELSIQKRFIYSCHRKRDLKAKNADHKDEGSIMLTGSSIVRPTALLPVGDVNADPAMVSRSYIKHKPVRITA